MTNPTKQMDPAEIERIRQALQQAADRRSFRPAGHFSNGRIIQRNGGVRPQFIDDIGGCSSNYR